MLQHSRNAIALLALCAAAPAFAAESLPPELQALQVQAEHGNAIAQYNLGLAYDYGRGVPTDKKEAFVWLTLASEQGSTSKELDSLAARLSQADLAEAQQRLGDIRSSLGIVAPVAMVPTGSPAATAAPVPVAPTV